MQRIVEIVQVACIALLAGSAAACTPPASTDERGADTAPAAGQPLDSARVAARMHKARGHAITGNQQGIQTEVEGMQEDLRRSMKMPDPSRRIEPEAARLAARSVAGVTSANWIDRENLLVMVQGGDLRSHATIDRICGALEPLGDTLAVVVNLQNRAATTGEELEILSRNCQLAPGDRAFMQRNRQVDVIPPEIRAQHAATKRRMADEAGDREAEAAESLRILEASTPEL